MLAGVLRLSPLLLGLSLLAGPAAAADQNITTKVQNEAPVNLPSLAPLVERVLPAVVNVSVQLDEQAALQAGNDQLTAQKLPFDQFLKRFFEDPAAPGPRAGVHGEKIMAVGSGFVVDPSGYIVTNNHVVGNAADITVILQDNSRHKAKLVGRDEKTDVALLKIDTGDKKLPYVSWGDSSKAKVGDWVVAVGNPFGLGGTVTAGIISALGRNINEGPYDDFLQIDAPINRGNSGGPTFDLAGRVIGINTAIYSPSGGSVGIGFAIPSNLARNVVEQLKQNGHATWAWLGVEIQGITPAIAKSLGVNPEHPEGALVAAVIPDSPAAKAGLKSGDVITAADGHPIKDVHDLPRLVASTPIGHRIGLDVLRDGKQVSIAATVAEQPKKSQVAAAAPSPQEPAQETTALGLQMARLDPPLRARLHVPKDVDGVAVAAVAADSPGAALGIQPGDVIQSIDRKPVNSPDAAAKLLKGAAGSGNVLLLLNRHGVSEFVGLSVNGPLSGD